MTLAIGRILNNGVRNTTIGDLVGSFGQHGVHNTRHRFDRLRVDLLQLFNPFQDGVKFIDQRLNTFLRLCNSSEPRNLSHSFFINGHEHHPTGLISKRRRLPSYADRFKPGGVLTLRSALLAFKQSIMNMPDQRSDIQDLAAKMPPGTRLMGIDLGTKTIGLSVTDTRLRIASPLQTLKRTKFKENAAELNDLLQQHEISGIVIGLPLNMDGSSGPRVQATKAFARNLQQVTDVRIIFWDERLSTVAVTRTMLEADLSRKRRGELVDKMAAAYILQGALDYLDQNPVKSPD